MALEAGKASPVERTAGRTHALQIGTRSRVEFLDITARLHKLVEESGVRAGVCYVFVPHTTAALLINENDDPGLQKDLDKFLGGLAPVRHDYHHNDGNCDAHLKAALIGVSKTLLIEDRRLVLGRWQGVFFCEFDGPRRRELHVKIICD